jgi:hypothetical protein
MIEKATYAMARSHPLSKPRSSVSLEELPERKEEGGKAGISGVVIF